MRFKGTGFLELIKIVYFQRLPDRGNLLRAEALYLQHFHYALRYLFPKRSRKAFHRAILLQLADLFAHGLSDALDLVQLFIGRMDNSAGIFFNHIGCLVIRFYLKRILALYLEQACQQGRIVPLFPCLSWWDKDID